jgi:hypothetical protein
MSQPTPLLSLLFLLLQAIIPAITIPIITAPASTLGYEKELINIAKLYTDD